MALPWRKTIDRTILKPEGTAMQTILDPCDHPSTGFLTDRKSEFIGNACHITDQDTAMDFVEQIRLANPKARHVCHSAIWGPHGHTSERMSDDGEPSGTAGKPILEVMRCQDLTDCVVTVTRYFGGILLGSGGLIRAYSSAASLALEAARPARIVTSRRYRISVAYPDHDHLRRLIESVQGGIVKETFTDRVTMTYDIPLDQVEGFGRALTNLLQGRVSPTELETVQSPVPAH